MSDGPRLLLIDGNNLTKRIWFGAKQRRDGKGGGMDLTHNGRPTSMLFGCFKQLVFLMKKNPGFFPIFAWDGGYERRLRESEAGVAAGIIPSSYKQPRREAAAEPDKQDDFEDYREQCDEFKMALDMTRCIQVRMDGIEADDIIYSYSRTYAEWGGKSVIISTDKDFYQALDENTIVFDAMKKELWTAERLDLEFGFPPRLWVDAGAIMGEVGPSKDNIFGVDGWGEKTAYQYVREHGGIENIRAALEAKSKRGKKEQKFLDQHERLDLARSLKKMDVIGCLPKPRVKEKRDPEKLKKYFLEWGFISLLKEVNLLT